MAKALSTLLGTALLALLGSAALAAGGHTGLVGEAEASASASGCGLKLTPQTRTVRRGGRVLLQGSACGAGASSAAPSTVQVKLRTKNRWATVAKAETDASGDFSVCARVNVPRKAKVARLRATTGSGAGTTTVRVGRKGSSSCTPLYAPPPPETGDPDCPLCGDNPTIWASSTRLRPDGERRMASRITD